MIDFIVFETIFAVNLMKIIVTLDLDQSNCVVTKEIETSLNDNAAKMLELYKKYNLFYDNSESSMTDEQLSSMIIQMLKDNSHSFLRCSCIFFTYLTQIPLPDKIAEEDNFEVMLSYLNLNENILDYFEESSLLDLMSQCAQHEEVEFVRDNIKIGNRHDVKAIVPPHSPTKQLAALPKVYPYHTNLFLCLLCPGSRTDACNELECCTRKLKDKRNIGKCIDVHNRIYHTGAGIYMDTSSSEVLLLYSKTGFVLPAPYVVS